ncbi:T-kininogen 1-like isoform X2 [Bufo gargarizans]|uniref:T-kininogen 1-like isoform X2 n=1 Tax=Bufo gargarizans TaxID=30331 RepID=UPI001CF37661|nr:T-kininogen 1-like isoform X2 [Bufo gargarizans]
MRLLPILLLCCHCLLGSATVIDADCNDQTVFNAVDEALKSFNNEKEDGNQFILYRITDAKIKNEGDGQIHHFVEYETYESSCEVKSGKSWQECAPTYANQAKCSAHVLFNKDLKLRSVESQNCSSPKEMPETAVHRPCHPSIDKENKELLCFIHSTIEKINTDSNHPFYFDLESIGNATRQVINGWQYNIQFLIRQTNCSKINFTTKNAKECKIDNKGESFPCTALVWLTSDGNVYYYFVMCKKSDTGVCLNCPVVVEPEDPELLTLLAQVMDEYNFNSDHKELYKVRLVKKATKKGFHRELYEVNFRIKPTNCSKPDYSILGDECHIQASSGMDCTTQINVTDKTVSVHSGLQCGPMMLTLSLGDSYSGLSPLRFSRNIKHEENKTNSLSKCINLVERTNQPRQRRHGHNNRKEHKQDKKGMKNDKEKSGQKYPHQDSLEENKNEVTPAPPLHLTTPAIQTPAVLKVPDVSNSQETSPNTNKTSVLDFPGRPTDVVPRCPGTVWQPKSPIPSIPAAKTYSNGDLTPLNQVIQEN